MRTILAALVAQTLLIADGPPPNVRIDPERPGIDSFAFRANPSVIRVASWLSLFAIFLPEFFDEQPCAVLTLRTPSPDADVEVTTFGLGHATLATAQDPAGACQAGSARKGEESLHLAYSGQPEIHDWVLVVRPDQGPILTFGTEMEGQVIAFDEGVGMITLPLKVERLPMSPVLLSLVWAFGIAIPALLTYRLGRAADRRSERLAAEREATARQNELADKEEAARREQVEAFRLWRQEPTSKQAIESLVKEIGIAINTPEAGPHCLRLFQGMHAYGLLAKMPSESYHILLETCRTENQAELLKQLHDLFPEFPEFPLEWKRMDEP